MTPAVLALIALIVAIVVSMTSRINVGILSIALAWLIGVYGAHMKPEAVIAGFPATLFITLAGVTLLFAVAKSNRTLDVLAYRAARFVRGNAGLLPLVFFALACAIATVGPGAIASVALVAPIAMAAGARAGVPNFLTAVMVGTGANAGNLSPISAVGAMVDGIMVKIGLPGHEWRVWAASFFAHVLVAAAAYTIFGGVRLFRAGRTVEPDVGTATLDRRHLITIGITAAWALAAIVWRVNVGLSAFAAGAALILLGMADEQDVIRRVPLDIIFMVTGVTVLIGVLEATGGMELFTGMLARVSSPASLNAVIAFVTGVISTYSTDGAGTRPSGGRRRSAGGRALDQRRLVARRRLSALHTRRPVRRGGSRPLHRARPVQEAVDLGAIDGRGRCGVVRAIRECVRARIGSGNGRTGER